MQSVAAGPAPQLMLGGVSDDLTVPVPVLVTVSVTFLIVKVAVTVLAAVIDTVQGPVTAAHPPPNHFVKVELGLGVAVSVTLVL